MAKRLSLIALAVFSPLVLTCFFVEAAWSVGLFALLSMAYPVALMALGASKAGSLGPIGPYLAALLAWLCAVALLLVRPPAFLAGVTFFGAPWSAALMLLGLWVVPMAWTTFAYVRTFSSFGLRAEDLARIRRGPKR